MTRPKTGGSRGDIRRALHQFGPKVPQLNLPPGLKPDLFLTQAPEPTPSGSPMDHIRAVITGDQIFGRLATEVELRALVSSIPCGWLIWMCSALERLTHVSGPAQQRQLEYANELVPPKHMARVQELITQGQIFVHEEQLLALARLAIENAVDSERDATPAERSHFFELLIGANDLFTSEGPGEDADREALTAHGMRSLAFQGSQIFWHLIARGHAYWFHAPRALAGSRNHHDIDALFKAATGAPLESFFAVTIAAFAHGEKVQQMSDPNRWSGWTLDPKALIANPADPEGLAGAWAALSADQAGYRAMFAAQTPAGSKLPRYSGVAMDPFRQRPIFRFASGNAVVLSSRYLIEGLAAGVFWRIADHLKADPEARDDFTKFAGEIHQHHVFELMRSAFDLGEVRRVFGDGDARWQGQQPNSADALAFLADHSIFAEATITGFRYGKTIVPADLVAFDADIRRTLAAKSKQLQDAVQAYREKRMRYHPFSDYATLGRTIWPILVVRDPLPTFALLTDRIARLLRDDGATLLDPPVAVLSTEELELLLRAGDDGRARRLLTEWRCDPAYSGESFRNFYLERYPADSGSVPYLQAQADAAFDVVRRQLNFPTRAKGGEAA